MMYEPDFINLLIKYDLITIYYTDMEIQQELYKCNNADAFLNFSEYFAIKHNVEVSQKVGINAFLDACYNIANKDKNLWEVPLYKEIN